MPEWAIKVAGGNPVIVVVIAVLPINENLDSSNLLDGLNHNNWNGFVCFVHRNAYAKCDAP